MQIALSDLLMPEMSAAVLQPTTAVAQLDGGPAPLAEGNPALAFQEAFTALLPCEAPAVPVCDPMAAPGHADPLAAPQILLAGMTVLDAPAAMAPQPPEAQPLLPGTAAHLAGQPGAGIRAADVANTADTDEGEVDDAPKTDDPETSLSPEVAFSALPLVVPVPGDPIFAPLEADEAGSASPSPAETPGAPTAAAGLTAESANAPAPEPGEGMAALWPAGATGPDATEPADAKAAAIEAVTKADEGADAVALDVAAPSGSVMAGAAVRADAAQAIAPRTLPALETTGPGWPVELTDRIRFAVDADRQTIEMDLLPAHMGALRIRVEQAGEETRVTFLTQTHAAERLLQQAQPQLGAMLAEAGLSLMDQQTQNGPPSGGGQPWPPAPLQRLREPGPVPPAAPATAAGLVNLIA